MREARHDESRMEFQVERMIMFTDGVFAIAITLLVIEIKVPIISIFTDQALLQSLADMGLKFFGFLISFGIVGHYWLVHHRIFGYVQKYNSTLIWLNFAYLFSIVTLPFSSGLVGEYIPHTDIHIPYIIYTINMCVTGIMNCILWLYVSNPNREFLTRKLSKARISLGVYRSLVIPSVFILSMIISFVSPIVSRILLLLIPATLHWGFRGLETKADKQEHLHPTT